MSLSICDEDVFFIMENNTNNTLYYNYFYKNMTFFTKEVIYLIKIRYSQKKIIFNYLKKLFNFFTGDIIQDFKYKLIKNSIREFPYLIFRLYEKKLFSKDEIYPFIKDLTDGFYYFYYFPDIFPEHITKKFIYKYFEFWNPEKKIENNYKSL